MLWEQPAHGFELLAKRVGLHAVTRDAATFPEPCLYVQLLLSDAAADDAVSELFLVPPDAAALEPLFDALSRTAELNPDSDDESDGESDGMLGIAGAEDEPDADAMLRRFDAMLADAPAPALPGFARVEGQFDDAADDDGGGFDDL